jgi:Tfp pilus assembly protein PilW
MKRRAGFSLAEVAVAAAIVGIVTFYMSELLVRQSRTYTVVDNVSEAQQNLRAIARLLESELRNTGYVVQMASALCGYDTGSAAGADADPDVLFVTDASALAAPLAEDSSGTTLYPNAPKSVTGNPGAAVNSGVSGIASAGGISSTAASIVLSDLVIDGYAYYDVDGDGVKDSDFQYNAANGRSGGVILFENNAPDKGAACGLIADIDVGSNTLTVDFTVNGAQPGSGLAATANPLSVRAVPAHVYWIQNDANGVPGLMRDGMLLSPDVEDLQFAAFYDLDDDGDVDGSTDTSPPFHSATEYPGSSAANSQFLSSGFDNSLLREIRATIVLRTRSQDPHVLADASLASQMPQSFENRVAWAGAADGYRRRALTVTVQPRNVARRANFGS